MSLDFNKPVQTRNGQPVHIVSILGRQPYPVIGYIGNTQVLRSWTPEGALNASLRANGVSISGDLVNVPPPKTEAWVNLYIVSKSDPSKYRGYSYSTRQEADFNASSDRVACVRVEYSEGEGL